MHYLASKGFVHRDLAARNVFVSAEDTCRVRSLQNVHIIYTCKANYKASCIASKCTSERSYEQLQVYHTGLHTFHSYKMYIATMSNRLVILGCREIYLRMGVTRAEEGKSLSSGWPLRRFTGGSTLLPAMCGAMAVCSSRYGVWGENHSEALRLRR